MLPSEIACQATVISLSNFRHERNLLSGNELEHCETISAGRESASVDRPLHGFAARDERFPVSESLY